MANIKSAIKRAELNVVANERNSQQKSAMRTAIKKFETAPSEDTFKAASSAIDKAASKGLIHAKLHVTNHVWQLNWANS